MHEWHLPSLWHSDLDPTVAASESTFPPLITPKWKAAFHESGHAVSCFQLFHRLDHVTIVSTSDYRGYMQGVDADWQEKTGDQRRAHIAKIATITLCGGASVERLLGTMRGVEMREDLAALYKLLKKVADTEEETDLFTDRCWKQAQRLVQEEWPAIRAVASALKEKKMLTGDEVGEIIRMQIDAR